MLKNTVNILTVQKHLFLVNYTKNNLYLISNSKLSNISTITSTTSNEQNEKETIEKQIDPFTEEFGKNQIKISTVQRFILSIGSSLAALVNPRRHDMIACLGETTGVSALENIYKQMKLSDEGRQILIEKPRINTKTIDMNSLKKLPDNTFGKAYFKFLEENNVTPDSRMDVRFMDNPELAYVMTRYRECHDLIHTTLGMPTNMLGEVAVKWVEALNTGLPMCYGGAVFGAVRLRPKQRLKYTTIYLPWAISNGKVIKPLLNVYWERRWNQDINELRKELGITVL